MGTSNCDEEYHDNYEQHHPDRAIRPETVNKRYANIRVYGRSPTMDASDSRFWAIPYRFGKRASIPYRFGKRASIPYRFGKRASIPYRFGKRAAAMPYRFGKRAAAMPYRFGKKNTSV